MDEWILRMFGCSVVGSFFALLWPILVALFKRHRATIYKWITPDVTYGATTEKPRSRVLVVFQDCVLPAIIFLVVAAIIAVVSAGVGFFAFLNQEDTRTTLKSLGALGYFASFSYGFSTGSMIEEPLKK